MSEFDDIRRGFTERMESLIVDVMATTRPDGILINGGMGARVIISDFKAWMNDVEKSYNSEGIVMHPAPGGVNNYE